MFNQLHTRWGTSLDENVVLPEYPRPHMVRENYRNLNGYWEYAISKSSEIPREFDGRILVPFSPESTLSGVNRIVQPDEYLHYRLQFHLTEKEAGQRLLLHFGAVDQMCSVFINYVYVGSHSGGYLPFSFDISKFVSDGSNDINVVVNDYSDTSYHARGKQKLNRGGMFYQAQSGMWKSVWTEWVPQNYISDIKLLPSYDEGKVEITVMDNRSENIPVHIEIMKDGMHIGSAGFLSNQRTGIDIPDYISWTPESPHLYDVIITMGEDRITSYFAMRKYSVGRDSRGLPRFMLNNKPYFHNGLLDQGYWPDGLMTAPEDAALIYDIQTMKDLGYNMIRKHIKIEPERWYYHCDKLGMLVWQDMINGGREYHMNFVCALPNKIMWTGHFIKDHMYRAFARQDKQGREDYYIELKGMIDCLYNFPSIAAWVPFNEGWGQFDAGEASRRVRKWDPSRLIDEASGWFDQFGGDMFSIHNYWRPLKIKPKRRVVALTEYGGYSCRMAGHSFCEEIYGYRDYKNSKDLTAGYKGLIERDILPNIKNGLSAVIYTQVSDVEEEVNGILTYDRECLKLDVDTVKELNRRIYQEFDACI